MLDHITHVRCLHGVQDIPEVGAIRESAIRGGIRHELHEVVVGLHPRPELLDRELVVVRDVHIFDLVDLQQLFLFTKNLFKEVLVYHFLRRHVELKVLGKVFDKVSLGTELAHELVNHHSPLLGAVKLC